MSRRPVFAPLLGAFILVASSAAAQGAPAHPQKPLTVTLQGTAKEAYASARLLFKQGDFAGAATKYQQAYELSKDPRLLFDTAICEKNLRAYARMQELLEQYNREASADMSADDRAAVDGALAAVKNLIGRLTVTVDVSGATVSVDGQAVGTTPLAAPLVLDLGKHVITVEGSGLQTVSRDVSIVGGADAALNLAVTPQEQTAQLFIVAEPNAMISLDGTPTSKERYEGKVQAGAHEVRVTEPGKLPYKADVDLKVGETRTLQVTLTSESHPVIWPWVVGGAVVVAGAVVGGYFLFKPSDQTVPVPTGASGAVQFSGWRFR
jgi:PEGA domain